MARWIRDEQLNQPSDFVAFIMNDYLNKNLFKKVTHKGQEVWKEGNRLLGIEKFVSYKYENGCLHLEAWVGGKKENPIEGFAGAVPKKIFREGLEELIKVLHQPLPEGQTVSLDQVVKVQVVDYEKYAVPALVCSIIAVFSLLFAALLGLILSFLGISLGQKAKSSGKATIANVAVVLGTIALVLSIAIYVLNIFAAGLMITKIF